MASLVDLLQSPVQRARLEEATTSYPSSRPRHELRHADDWRDAREIARSGRIDLLVFNPFAPERPAWQECYAFHEAFPSIALVPYTDTPVECAENILRLKGLDVTTILVHDHNDAPLRMRKAFTEALQLSVPSAVLESLAPLVPGDLEALLEHLMREARRPVEPAELARFYCRHPKTLREHLKAAGLPTTQTLIGWARLFHAAGLLRDPARNVENVALTLKFPSTSALRQQLYRYARMCPTELMHRDGLDMLLEHFHDRYVAQDWTSYDRGSRETSDAEFATGGGSRG